jgi:hypothetical protein
VGGVTPPVDLEACASRVYEFHRERDIRRGRVRARIPRWEELDEPARCQLVAEHAQTRASYDAGARRARSGSRSGACSERADCAAQLTKRPRLFCGRAKLDFKRVVPMQVVVNDKRCTLFHGNAANVVEKMDENSVDAIVTDPPAGIGFMGIAWDADKGGRDEWIAWLAGIMRGSLRVLEPGGHALVWAIPRTSH